MNIIGMPTAVFLPANFYTIEYDSDLVEASVPIKGLYPEDYSKSGEFNISPENGMILEGVLLDVLFAFKSYPRLESTQVLMLFARQVNYENNQIVIVGRIARVTPKVGSED